MKTVTLVDTRQAIAGESIGTVVSTLDTILAAFNANEDFQSRMRASGDCGVGLTPGLLRTLPISVVRCVYRMRGNNHATGP